MAASLYHLERWYHSVVFILQLVSVATSCKFSLLQINLGHIKLVTEECYYFTGNVNRDQLSFLKPKNIFLMCFFTLETQSHELKKKSLNVKNISLNVIFWVFAVLILCYTLWGLEVLSFFPVCKRNQEPAPVCPSISVYTRPCETWS